ncbi:hypothetical protein BOTBODRAFT_172513 [Botryobasidium botryosum FD-172 SS1]|uniref:Uncharacterized protein n=1 Tax=Botryobasidium botryosum (strain FD-172 SS1) TaxID=930990 RepID=A0A067MQC7_BOTB1|nr:hypothetical protein BOTBODRAFT_172513 [Botryobasidium botryosum FD-172 SS1]
MSQLHSRALQCWEFIFAVCTPQCHDLIPASPSLMTSISHPLISHSHCSRPCHSFSQPLAAPASSLALAALSSHPSPTLATLILRPLIIVFHSHGSCPCHSFLQPLPISGPLKALIYV